MAERLGLRLYEVTECGKLVPLAGSHVFPNLNNGVARKVEEEMNVERAKTGGYQVVLVPVIVRDED